MPLNFVDAADRSTSSQHEIIALFRHPESSSTSQSTCSQICYLDGRSFHPVSQYDVVDDVFASTDPDWDVRMELDPIQWANPGMDASRMTSDFSSKHTQVADGESSVSSNLLEDASVKDATGVPPILFPDCISQLVQNSGQSQWQHQTLQRQVSDAVASHRTTIVGDLQQTVTSEYDQSSSSNVAGQDQRFKPFHEEKWNQRYKELLVFHSQHGHVGVPHTYPPNQQLARWIKR